MRHGEWFSGKVILTSTPKASIVIGVLLLGYGLPFKTFATFGRLNLRNLAIGLDTVTSLNLIGAISIHAGELSAAESIFRLVGEYLNSRLVALRKEGHRFIAIDTTRFNQRAFLFYGDIRMGPDFV